MMFAKIRRAIMMPFININRKRRLYDKVMLPEEIQNEEKKLHEMYILANKKGQKDLEKEYMYKRDALRKVLRINGQS